ncbi:hypothetical protein F7U66_01235 [Vibrio parahaemolyticus]|nr:hypothetical protein [Vibrio parahaemolyticus]
MKEFGSALDNEFAACKFVVEETRYPVNKLYYLGALAVEGTDFSLLITKHTAHAVYVGGDKPEILTDAYKYRDLPNVPNTIKLMLDMEVKVAFKVGDELTSDSDFDFEEWVLSLIMISHAANNPRSTI